MAEMDDNSIDFICTDPPYGLSFMGKDWDHGIPGIEFWKQALRICKPGSMLAAFGGTRTYHRLTCAIEDAGWEIRDCMMFLYGTGFPKSHNFGRKMEGDWKKYGTALKPAHEPIILAMKPLDGTFAHNAEKWGVAGINIDSSRIQMEEKDFQEYKEKRESFNVTMGQTSIFNASPLNNKIETKGRWPANLILDEESAEALDQMTGILKSGSGDRRPNGGGQMFNGFSPMKAEFEASSGGASRFFYCAKTSSFERNAGLEGMPLKETSCQYGYKEDRGRNGYMPPSPKTNNHPTVKPLALMRYLIKLLAPPGNPILLDPFAGSGTTIIAAKQLGISAIGIELSEEYCEIARKRIDHAQEISEQLEMSL